MDKNDFFIDLVGGLQQTKTRKQINADIRQLEKTINMLRITGIFAKGDTKKGLNQYIKELGEKLNYVKLKGKLDEKSLKREIDKSLHNMTFKEIDALNIDGSKAKLKIKKVMADVKAYVEKTPITVNVQLKKEKLGNDLTTFLNKNSKIKESSVFLAESERIRELIDSVDDKGTLRNATDAFSLFTNAALEAAKAQTTQQQGQGQVAQQQATQQVQEQKKNGYKAYIENELIGSYKSEKDANNAAKNEVEKRAAKAGKNAADKENDPQRKTQAYQNAYNGTGNLLTNRIRIVAYADGTTNAKKGLHLVSENEFGDEIIIKNDKSAVIAHGEQLYPFEGGETVIKASETEKILDNTDNLVPVDGITFGKGENAVHFTQEEWMNKLQSIMPSFSNMVQIPKFQMPKYDFVTNRSETTPVVQNITLTLPNVTNNSGYERIQKELKQMQIDAYQFAHRR